MAKKRLDRKVLLRDIKAFASLQAIGDYNASNERFTVAEIIAAHQAVEEKRRLEVQKRGEADAARDAAADAEWRFHALITGAKTQVKAQFGESSDELQALGAKKKSEYRKGGRRPKKDGV